MSSFDNMNLCNDDNDNDDDCHNVTTDSNHVVVAATPPPPPPTTTTRTLILPSDNYDDDNDNNDDAMVTTTTVTVIDDDNTSSSSSCCSCAGSNSNTDEDCIGGGIDVATASAVGSSTTTTTNSSFHLFSYLSDDIKVNILSYVAHGPYERIIDMSDDDDDTNNSSSSPSCSVSTSTLTHVFPYVSKKVYSLVNDNESYFWKMALIRQVRIEPQSWQTALQCILDQHTNDNEQQQQKKKKPQLQKQNHHHHHHRSNNNNNTITPSLLHHHRHRYASPVHEDDDHGNDDTIMVDAVEAFVVNVHDRITTASYKDLYRTIVSEHILYDGPLFVMPGHVQLGQSYSLHLFEPRYKLMIAEIMKHHDESARSGGRISSCVLPKKNATFVHAHRQPIRSGTPALLVQITRCVIQPNDGSADVTLLPYAYVYIGDNIRIRPQSGNLVEATCIRMDKHDTNIMTKTARQDVLIQVLSNLASQLSNTMDDDVDNDGYLLMQDHNDHNHNEDNIEDEDVDEDEENDHEEEEEDEEE